MQNPIQELAKLAERGPVLPLAVSMLISGGASYGDVQNPPLSTDVRLGPDQGLFAQGTAPATAPRRRTEVSQ